jgi:hypothetical protein
MFCLLRLLRHLAARMHRLRRSMTPSPTDTNEMPPRHFIPSLSHNFDSLSNHSHTPSQPSSQQQQQQI